MVRAARASSESPHHITRPAFRDCPVPASNRLVNPMTQLDEMLRAARELSWSRFGKQIHFHLPGMFCCSGTTGKYPAVSITGTACKLQCGHCRGKLLAPMLQAAEPDLLVRRCLDVASADGVGVLISGGCDENGRLPWAGFVGAIAEVKKRTRLKVSIHSGFLDVATAPALKDAGVDQVLVDVIGDDDTYREVYHIESGVQRLLSTLDALKHASLSVVPHIVCGIRYGRISGEHNAVQMVSRLGVPLAVFVSLMRVPETPMWNAKPPAPECVAELIAQARLRMPDTELSLGCARERGNERLEVLAVDAGINRLALPSEEARRRAEQYGLITHYRKTCCSVANGTHCDAW